MNKPESQKESWEGGVVGSKGGKDIQGLTADENSANTDRSHPWLPKTWVQVGGDSFPGRGLGR